MQFYSSGARIADRYEVIGRPLVGGMRVVYLCLGLEETYCYDLNLRHDHILT